MSIETSSYKLKSMKEYIRLAGQGMCKGNLHIQIKSKLII